MFIMTITNDDNIYQDSLLVNNLLVISSLKMNEKEKLTDHCLLVLSL